MTQWLNLEPETTPSSKTVNRAESMRLKVETDFKADEIISIGLRLSLLGGEQKILLIYYYLNLY